MGCAPSMYGLIAIAFEPTLLLPRTIASSSLLTIAGWFNHFSTIEGFPTLATPIENNNSSQHISMGAGEQYTPADSLVWVQIKGADTAAVDWIGQLETSITPQSGYFPLGKGTWIEATDAVEIRAVETQTLVDSDQTNLEQINKGIELFHRHALTVVEQIVDKRDQEEFQQFESRQQLNQQTAETTLKGLASLLQPEDDSYLVAQTPLLIAAGAVGHALGVKVCKPNDSEDLQKVKEPLEAIARASQLRLRQVLLRGNWWRADSGPMVVYTREDQLPMALLPVKDNRYELLNPVTLKRESVTEAVANRLDPRAFVFYRPPPTVGRKLQQRQSVKLAFWQLPIV
ncbi:MAG: hypothetical protein AAGL17_22890 [Cyanobacteria bacterium J06576_12]